MRGPRGGACQGPGAAGLQAGLPPGAVPSHTDAHSALWPVRWDRGYDPCSAFLADKKMMSPASATGTPQIYPQGSPFPPGHSGKAFRYVPWRGRWGKDAPAREAWVPALGSVCGRHCRHQLVVTAQQAPGRLRVLVALGLPCASSVVAMDAWCQSLCTGCEWHSHSVVAVPAGEGGLHWPLAGTWTGWS